MEKTSTTTMSVASPEQIRTYGSKQSRPLILDKNVVASFGVFFRLGIPTIKKRLSAGLSVSSTRLTK